MLVADFDYALHHVVEKFDVWPELRDPDAGNKMLLYSALKVQEGGGTEDLVVAGHFVDCEK